MPRDPLRTRVTSRPRTFASRAMALATSSAPTERAAASRGTKKLHGAHRAASATSAIELRLIEAADETIVEQGRRRQSAIAEAIDILHRQSAIGGGIAGIEAIVVAQMIGELRRP